MTVRQLECSVTRLRFGIFPAPFHAAARTRPAPYSVTCGSSSTSTTSATTASRSTRGQAHPTLDARRRASEAREGLAEQQNIAVAYITEKYQTELADRA
jgi:hypothetical protein